MKLRLFRSLFTLLFLGFLVGIYLVNPALMSWTLFITAALLYIILETVISFIIARDRSEEEHVKFDE
ncbi:hypothetical protein [Salinicoccus kekensis]|uniref:Uncharacterized protein n=1 Tax=Salinicoccus kekensis TaxID=714307 RepID=A0A285UBI9_9STAP|nr:hypothetical protein [Salinicoccus kekensis]SOC39103.1 hypothetical protein SAMN05878391_0717 [Salinicoccus kekensis]